MEYTNEHSSKSEIANARAELVRSIRQAKKELLAFPIEKSFAAASAMGRKGGLVTSSAKQKSSRLNGRRGGAPKGNKNAQKSAKAVTPIAG